MWIRRGRMPFRCPEKQRSDVKNDREWQSRPGNPQRMYYGEKKTCISNRVFCDPILLSKERSKSCLWNVNVTKNRNSGVGTVTVKINFKSKLSKITDLIDIISDLLLHYNFLWSEKRTKNESINEFKELELFSWPSLFWWWDISLSRLPQDIKI